jgi:hypothetical protein
VDEIDVTPAVRQAWRAHLASYYPYLAPVDRFWFANAPFTLAAIQTGWAQLDPQQQGMYKQAWAMSLPAMLQLVDPVLQAQQASPQAAFGAGSVADHVLGQPQPTAQLSDENAAQEELYNHSVNLQLLTNMSTVGANNTIGLMQAYNRMS